MEGVNPEENLSHQPSLNSTGVSESPLIIGDVTLEPASAKEFKRLIISSSFIFNFNSLINNAAQNIYDFYKGLVKDDKDCQIDKLNEVIRSVQKGIATFIGWQRVFNLSGEIGFMPQNLAPSQINLGYYLWRNASDCCVFFLRNLSSLLKLSDDIIKERFDLDDDGLSLRYNGNENEFNINIELASEDEDDSEVDENSELNDCIRMRENCYSLLNNVKSKLAIFFGPINQNDEESKDFLPTLFLNTMDSPVEIPQYAIPTPLRYAAQSQVRLRISEVLTALIQKQLSNCSVQQFSEALKMEIFPDTNLGEALAGPYGISAHPTMKTFFRSGKTVISWQIPRSLYPIWLNTGSNVLVQRLAPLTKIFEELGCNISISYKKNSEFDTIEATLYYISKEQQEKLSPYEQLEKKEITIPTELEPKKSFTFFLGFTDRSLTSMDIDKDPETPITDLSTSFIKSAARAGATDDFKELLSDESYFESLSDDEHSPQNGIDPEIFNEDFETLTTIDVEYFKDPEKRKLIAKAIDELLSFNTLSQFQTLTISGGEVSATYSSPIGQNPGKKNHATKVFIPLAAFSSQEFLDNLHSLLDKTTVTNLQFCWTTHEAIHEVVEQLDAVLGVRESVCTNRPSEQPYYLSLRPSTNNPNLTFCEIGIDESTPLVFAQYNQASQHFVGRHIPIEFYSQLVNKLHRVLGVGDEKGTIGKQDFFNPCFSEIFFSRLRQEHIIVADSLKIVFLMAFDRFKRSSADVQASNILKLVDDIFLHSPSLNVQQLKNGNLFLSPLQSLYVFPAYSQIVTAHSHPQRQ